MPDDLRTPPDQPQQPPPSQPPYQAPYQPPGQPQYAPAPPPGSYAVATGPPGRIRPTGMTILLAIVTLGIYMFFYYYLTHEEIRRHSGTGLGGPLALVIALVFNVASPFLLSYEVGGLYERAGQAKPVSGLTGLWVMPGFLILVGPFIWMIKTNGALNDYWRSRGAVG
jgi:hypothetical protein